MCACCHGTNARVLEYNGSPRREALAGHRCNQLRSQHIVVVVHLVHKIMQTRDMGSDIVCGARAILSTRVLQDHGMHSHPRDVQARGWGECPEKLIFDRVYVCDDF